ncbi:hypothetical protein [Xylophilus sp. GOD-11R]|uniref:hypothetical protein n=1 Tax=Xylophilus sp. GOD-11R TaxID=3089814 RepID=UPI00298CFFCD|nr:hypothetical protein [Xylophilus sp. GOD-11R]WPB57574.1 hypothetical protein R9X41_02635 [Xylophilus sp. GOD-11R]
MMLKVPQILVRAITLVGGTALLVACGQKGVLFLPTETASRQRAPLVETLKPNWARSRPATPANPAPTTPATPPTLTNTPPTTDSELVPQTVLSP